MSLTLRLPRDNLTALRDLPSRRSPHTAALWTLAIPNYGVSTVQAVTFSLYTLPKLFICLLLISVSPYAFTTSNDSPFSYDLFISCPFLTSEFPSLYHTDNSRSCRRMRLALRQRHLKRDLLSFNTARSYFKVCAMAIFSHRIDWDSNLRSA
jgi:hypothetical protein